MGGHVWIMNKIKKFLGGFEVPENYGRLQFFEKEIARWKASPARKLMLIGERYYEGYQDVLERKRTVIGEGGQLVTVENLPNNRILDNQFAKMVDQKVNYLLSKPLTFETGNDAFDKALKDKFNRTFLNTLKNGGVDALCGGVSWLYVYYNEQGKLAFQRFKPYEILPFWKDAEHTQLDCAVRLYPVEVWEGNHLKIIEKVEIFTTDGIERYALMSGRLIEDVENPSGYYAYIGEKGYNWEQIPLIAFKYNAREIPLIHKVKGLQDALNDLLSDFMNNMQENNMNTVLVVKNYDGQNSSELRRNLATTRTINVRTIDGADGGVETLNIEVNAQNYELVLKCIKKSIIENAKGYDAKDDRMGGNANMMNLRSMYSDIDLDADGMESEYQASFEKLLEFVRLGLVNEGKGDFKDVDVKVTFNRDIVINETEVIDNLVKLGVQLPNELLVSQVPFVDDVQGVMDMLKKEKEESMDVYGDAFKNPALDDKNSDNDENDE